MKNGTYTLASAEKKIRDYCKAHRIRIHYPDEQPGRDEGASAGRTVWIGPTKDAERLIEIFCHELGHIQMERVKEYGDANMYVREVGAWYRGFVNMQEIFGISPQLAHAKFAERKLRSYSKGPEETGGYDYFWYEGK